MTTYILRRLLQGIIVIIIVSILVFLMMRWLPGDPIMLYIADNELELLSEADVQSLRAEWGLDKPMPLQYFDWVSGLLRGDFGRSILYDTPVATLMAERFPITLYLGIIASLLSIIFGLAAGLVCALRRGKLVDTMVTSAANVGISIPNFWLAILLIYLFGLYLGWLPIHGYTSPFQDFWMSIRQLIMPVFCLALIPLAVNTRQTRSSMLEVVRQDYIRTAWSKGLRERDIVFKHAMKNGLIPIITVMGAHFRMIFGGSVFIETVFNIPGMGRLLVSSALGQDYSVVQGIILIIAGVVVISNLTVDISYGWLDPRIRFG